MFLEAGPPGRLPPDQIVARGRAQNGLQNPPWSLSVSGAAIRRDRRTSDFPMYHEHSAVTRVYGRHSSPFLNLGETYEFAVASAATAATK